MASKFGTLRSLLPEIIWTMCLIIIFWINVPWAATYPEREIPVTEQVSRYNYESLLAFAALALCIIGIIVVWTAYRQRRLWAWFIMVVFVFVYFVPASLLLDSVSQFRRLGWHGWSVLFDNVAEGRPYARFVLRSMIIFVAMLVALLLPVRGFFRKQA